MTIERFEPHAQIAFAQRLLEIDALHLSPALGAAVDNLDISELDAQLASLVPHERLRRVAAMGVRGERVFPMPLVLQQDPRLIAYYRLLYGLSQKEFYRKLGRFKSMEDKGSISDRALEDLNELCEAMC